MFLYNPFERYPNNRIQFNYIHESPIPTPMFEALGSKIKSSEVPAVTDLQHRQLKDLQLTFAHLVLGSLVGISAMPNNVPLAFICYTSAVFAYATYRERIQTYRVANQMHEIEMTSVTALTQDGKLTELTLEALLDDGELSNRSSNT